MSQYKNRVVRKAWTRVLSGTFVASHYPPLSTSDPQNTQMIKLTGITIPSCTILKTETHQMCNFSNKAASYSMYASTAGPEEERD